MINFEWEDDLRSPLDLPKISVKIIRRDEYSTEYGYLDKDGNFFRHRDGGPAVIFSNGGEGWFQNGLCHRIDGPAIIYSTGTKFWCQNNLRHRKDGPAIIYADGTEEWYINDVSQEDLCERLRVG